MKDLKIDFVNKKIKNEAIEGTDRTLQQIHLGVQTWLGHWYLDNSIGVDYINGITNKSIIDSKVKDVITNAENVTSIDNYQLKQAKDIYGRNVYSISSQISIGNVPTDLYMSTERSKELESIQNYTKNTNEEPVDDTEYLHSNYVHRTNYVDNCIQSNSRIYISSIPAWNVSGFSVDVTPNTTYKITIGDYSIIKDNIRCYELLSKPLNTFEPTVYTHNGEAEFELTTRVDTNCLVIGLYALDAIGSYIDKITIKQI